MTVLQLTSLAKTGGSLNISAKEYTTLQLQSIAKSLEYGAKLYLRDSKALTVLAMQSISKCKPGSVIFLF